MILRKVRGMRISSKVECGITALVDIAMNSGGEAVTVYSISNRQNISAKYLEQILSSLRRDRLIKSLKGAKGGYILARPASKITFKDILNSLDPALLNDDFSDDDSSEQIVRKTVRSYVWDKMTEYLQSYAESVTLENIVNKCSDEISESSDNFMYYI